MKMGNTHGLWFLYCIVLIFYFFLIAEKQRSAAKSSRIKRGIVEINQSRYFKNV